MVAAAPPAAVPLVPARRSTSGQDVSINSSSSGSANQSLNASTATVQDGGAWSASANRKQQQRLQASSGGDDEDSADAASVDALEQRIREGELFPIL